VTKLRKESFAPFVNQVFTICLTDDRTISIKLSSITTRDANDQYESFILNFDPSEGELALPDGSYMVENAQFGQAVIFISPTPAGGPDPGKYYYEAIFNAYIGPEDD
jgi:hypothetical protein